MIEAIETVEISLDIKKRVTKGRKVPVEWSRELIVFVVITLMVFRHARLHYSLLKYKGTAERPLVAPFPLKKR